MPRALAVLVHDAALPATMRMEEWNALQLASCKVGGANDGKYRFRTIKPGP
jgi:protocatechuate 3,4-dioxygenase beta subunit